jgi:hypothetical protein
VGEEVEAFGVIVVTQPKKEAQENWEVRVASQERKVQENLEGVQVNPLHLFQPLGEEGILEAQGLEIPVEEEEYQVD